VYTLDQEWQSDQWHLLCDSTLYTCRK